jgi:hypothetical protein
MCAFCDLCDRYHTYSTSGQVDNREAEPTFALPRALTAPTVAVPAQGEPAA